MATDFKLPNLGEGVDGGDVIDVLVSPGDQVVEGQPLVELETSKATVAVPAPSAGRVTKLHIKKGDRAEVGQLIATIENGSGKAAPAKDETPEPTEATPAQSAAPAARQPTAPPAGVAPAAAAAAPAPARAAPKAPPQAPALRPEPQAPEASGHGEPIAAGPAIRRLARELGVDLRMVQATAPGGRITEEDVKAYVREITAGQGAGRPLAGGRAAEPPPLPDFGRWGTVRREPMPSIRRKTAEQMSLAWSLIPQVTQFDEADITELESYRKKHAARAEARGGKLTVTAVALKAAAVALKVHPQFNSSLDARTGELILKDYYHVGIAVDTDRGLIVPVLRDVERKSILDLAAELTDLAERTRQKKITLEELQGGTFTITNLGGIGGTHFSPIVNYPEVAILGLARARQQQVVREGRAEIRWILPLCLSYDHRVIDGAEAARFTRLIAELVEDPVRLVLEA